MQLAHPQALWLLTLLPLVWLCQRVAWRRQTAAWFQLAAPLSRPTPGSHTPRTRRPVTQTLFVLLPFVTLPLALADPRLPSGPPRLRPDSLEAVMAIDVSLSMQAEDYHQQSRLERARRLIDRLLHELRDNRVGLVTFAGRSFRQAELSTDMTALSFIVQHWVQVNAAGVGGSNLVEALETALDMLRPDSGRTQVVFLFSDGGDDSTGLDPVVDRARRQGVRVMAVGLGSPRPARIPLTDAQGQFQGYLEQDGQVLTTRLNEVPLKRLARETNGTYVRLTAQPLAPAAWWHALPPAEVVEQDDVRLFQPLVWLGLLAWSLQTLIGRLGSGPLPSRAHVPQCTTPVMSRSMAMADK